MGLRGKFFLMIVVAPAVCLGLLLHFSNSIFKNYAKTDVFERQLNLLGAAHLHIGKSEAELASRVKEIVSQPGFESFVMADSSGVVRYAAQASNIGKKIADVISPSIVQRLDGQKIQEGSFELESGTRGPLLVSFLGLDLKSERLLLFLERSRDSAVRASVLFFFKGGSALLALIAILIVGNHFMFEQHIRGMAEVSSGLELIEKGQIESPWQAPKSDEFAKIVKQFNQMRLSLKTLFEQKNKEGQVVGAAGVASLVKSRAFPASVTRVQRSEIAAYSEMGKVDGKWWYHFRTGSRLVFISASVNKQGIEQASVMTAMRSSVSFVKDNFAGPAKYLEGLNKMIIDCGIQEVKVNAFVAALNAEDGTIEWSNAGHSMPVLVPNPSEESASVFSTPLMGDKGVPLGESSMSEFATQNEQIGDGDFLLVSNVAPTVVREIASAVFSVSGAFKLGAEAVRESAKKVVLANQSATSGEMPSLIVVKWRSPS